MMAAANILTTVEFENGLLAAAFSDMTGVEIVTSRKFPTRNAQELAKGNRVVTSALTIDTVFKLTYNTLQIEDFVYTNTGFKLPSFTAPLRTTTTTTYNNAITNTAFTTAALSTSTTYNNNNTNTTTMCTNTTTTTTNNNNNNAIINISSDAAPQLEIQLHHSNMSSVSLLVSPDSTILDIRRLMSGMQLGVPIEDINIRIPPPITVCILVLDVTWRDVSYDYDFTGKVDKSIHTRGGRIYNRPCGWKRIAIKVLGKYQSDKWLTRGDTDKHGDWPVSYHGTSGSVNRDVLSRSRNGVCSFPSLSIPSAETLPVVYEGKRYKVVLQNRINITHNRTSICAGRTGVQGDMYLTPDPTDIRPYGIIYKQV